MLSENGETDDNINIQNNATKNDSIINYFIHLCLPPDLREYKENPCIRGNEKVNVLEERRLMALANVSAISYANAPLMIEKTDILSSRIIEKLSIFDYIDTEKNFQHSFFLSRMFLNLIIGRSSKESSDKYNIQNEKFEQVRQSAIFNAHLDLLSRSIPARNSFIIKDVLMTMNCIYSFRWSNLRIV